MNFCRSPWRAPELYKETGTTLAIRDDVMDHWRRNRDSRSPDTVDPSTSNEYPKVVVSHLRCEAAETVTSRVTVSGTATTLSQRSLSCGWLLNKHVMSCCVFVIVSLSLCSQGAPSKLVSKSSGSFKTARVFPEDSSKSPRGHLQQCFFQEAIL